MPLINSKIPTSDISLSYFNWPIVSFLLCITAIPGIPAIFILTLVILGPSADGGMSSMIHAVYFETPAAILVHGGAGILFFLCMPFQFSPALRHKHLYWHKTGGRITLLSGYVMAASGVWMHHILSPDVLGIRYMSLVIMSVAMCIAFSIALWHIIKGRVQHHRKWMIRAVAITLAAITPIFVEAILYLLFSQLEHLYAVLNQIQNDYGRLVGIGINLAITEYIFAKERFNHKTHHSLITSAKSQ